MANEQKTQEEYIAELEKKLKAALADLLNESASIAESCLFCKHNQECGLENCDCYNQTCCDLPYGECEKRRDTPCNGCNFKNHWEWRGVIE